MHPPTGAAGYPLIKLGRKFQTRLHMLILAAFDQPRPSADVECRHLDGNPANNRIENLRWGTKAENYDDRRGHGTANDGEQHGNAKLSNAAADLIRASRHRDSSLAEALGVTRSTISKVRRGTSWRGVGTPPTHIPGRKGERNGRAKLTNATVRLIRESPASDAELAARFSVCAVTIRSARRGLTWRHV